MTTYEQLCNQQYDLFCKMRELEKQMAVTEQAMKDERSRLVKQVQIIVRDGSTLFIRTDGKGIVAGKKNAHTERHVYEWNGKKGKKVIDATRASDRNLAVWLMTEYDKLKSVVDLLD